MRDGNGPARANSRVHRLSCNILVYKREIVSVSSVSTAAQLGRSHSTAKICPSQETHAPSARRNTCKQNCTRSILSPGQGSRARVSTLRASECRNFARRDSHKSLSVQECPRDCHVTPRRRRPGESAGTVVCKQIVCVPVPAGTVCAHEMVHTCRRHGRGRRVSAWLWPKCMGVTR